MNPVAKRIFPKHIPTWLLRPWQDLVAPQPLIRLEVIRICIPLTILGFLSSRLLHASEWLSTDGFQIPDLGHRDWRQPLYLAPLSPAGAWAFSLVTALSGLLVSAGFRTRISAGIFFACLAYLTLADRLEAFTVCKMGTMLALGLFLSPAGRAWSLDAWMAGGKENAGDLKTTWGNVRFFQAMILTLYCASGISKWRGSWVTHSNVLWTHMHDSYQTLVTYYVAKWLPTGLWRPLQYFVLGFEVLAPAWFILPWTRLPALLAGFGIHAFIGFCFGPVVWFALLMAELLYAGFAPESWFPGGLKTALKAD